MGKPRLNQVSQPNPGLTQSSLHKKVLREEIVNPLRKNQFVRADKVMKLRKLLDSLTSVTGLLMGNSVSLCDLNI